LETQATGTKEEGQKPVSEGEASLRSKNLRNWKQIKQTAKGARGQTDGEWERKQKYIRLFDGPRPTVRMRWVDYCTLKLSLWKPIILQQMDLY
jgi:hypothetical protein